VQQPAHRGKGQPTIDGRALRRVTTSTLSGVPFAASLVWIGQTGQRHIIVTPTAYLGKFSTRAQGARAVAAQAHSCRTRNTQNAQNHFLPFARLRGFVPKSVGWRQTAPPPNLPMVTLLPQHSLQITLATLFSRHLASEDFAGRRPMSRHLTQSAHPSTRRPGFPTPGSDHSRRVPRQQR
jgi:hypothetical protein